VLLLVDGLFLAGEMPRGSLSAYYHTGMRDVFVGSLCVVGVFLITYMAFHYNWDNLLSTLAGLAVLGVAVFPTGGNTPLTPLQERMGEKPVSTVHMLSAAIFILSLAVISFLFGRREGRRPDRTDEQQGRGKLLHWACGLVIIAAVAYVLITKWLGRFDEHSLFYGETIAVLAFGLSWLMKGLELDVLLGRAAPAPAPTAVPVSS
jgi:peptidoglycan/LPS O-acetylase OafA/YrhL